jgi:flagellar M-ring protein FliF
MAIERIRSLWKSLEPRGQMTIAGIGLLVIVTFYFLFQFASAKSYTPLVSGGDPSKVGEMTKALDSAGVAYKLANGGTEIDVLSSQTSQANIALAGKGLTTTGSQPGMELFDHTSLAMTDFQQKVDYQRALEGEIDNQVTQIQGVSGADVQLVIPDDTLFLNQGPKASAAVLLTTDGDLDPQTISGIAHLVSSAVKGLSLSQVTITDGTGALLWPNSNTSGGMNASSKLEAENLYSAQLGAQITSMLDATLGPGKALARVQADLNVDQTTLDSTTFAKKGTPTSKTTSAETLTSSGGGTVVPTTGTATTPTYSATSGGANSKSNYANKSGSTSYGVDRTTTRTVVAPGAVNHLDVALLIDSSVPKAEVTSIKASVASLAGIVPKRGDTLSVSSIAFAKQKPVTSTVKPTGVGAIMANPIGLAKYAGLALASLVFLFMMSRKIKRSEREGLAAEPTWLREIQRATPVGELEASHVRGELTDPAAQRAASLKAEAGEIAMRQPEQLAQQVGQWLKE